MLGRLTVPWMGAYNASKFALRGLVRTMQQENRDVPGLSGQTTQVGYMLDLRERTQTLSAVAGYFAFYGVGDGFL